MANMKKTLIRKF